jgi:hypothetical protein
MLGKEVAIDLLTELEREAEPWGCLLHERRCLLRGRCEVAKGCLEDGRHTYEVFFVYRCGIQSEILGVETKKLMVVLLPDAEHTIRRQQFYSALVALGNGHRF